MRSIVVMRVIFLFTTIQFSMMTSLNEFHRHPLNLEALIEAVHHPKKRLKNTKNTTIPVFYNVFAQPDNVTLATDILRAMMTRSMSLSVSFGHEFELVMKLF